MARRMRLRINWIGLAGGIVTIIVALTSLLYPWWQLKIGDSLVTVNVSPVNTNLDVLGKSMTLPLFWAMNITGILTFLLSGIIMIVYSFLPTKAYSKTLLEFSYKKPLYTLIVFMVLLLSTTFIIKTFLNLNIPLAGTTNSTFTIPLVQASTITIPISTEFQFPFWFAIAAAALCLVAKIYHNKFFSLKDPEVTLEVATPIAPEATVSQR